MQKNKRLLAPMLALVLASLACTINVGGPTLPAERIPVSPAAVVELDQQIQAAYAAGQASGTVTMQISEVQLTSYLAVWLQGQTQPIFLDPQVFLRDGQMRLYGQAQQGYFVANIGVIVTVGVDAEGLPELQITSADFGPLPVPDDLRNVLTDLIKEAYTGSIGPAATGFRLQTISIADGIMTLTGRIR